MTTATETVVTTQVHRVYIKATPQQVWDAITQPGVDRAVRLPGAPGIRPAARRRVHRVRQPGHEGLRRARRRRSRARCSRSIPPHRLVQTWRMLFEPDQAAEPMTRITWEIEEECGVSR